MCSVVQYTVGVLCVSYSEGVYVLMVISAAVLTSSVCFTEVQMCLFCVFSPMSARMHSYLKPEATQCLFSRKATDFYLKQSDTLNFDDTVLAFTNEKYTDIFYKFAFHYTHNV